nr:citrate lyase acyl carrier protein [Propionibacterium sp.]
MRIVTEAIAGTLESSDALVRVTPSDELRIEVRSTVQAQYGARIREVVEETLAKLGVIEGLISVDDKGALDFVIAARVQGAVARASRDALDWRAL